MIRFKNLLKGALLAGAVSLTLNLSAQFTLSGEVRPRTEYRHGFKKPIVEGQDPALFTEQRTRLISSYKKDKVEFYVSLQDVRIWGGANQVYKSDPAMTNMHQAWGKYKFTDNLSITAGRMELNYDNARIMGNLGWAAQSRSHDLLKFTYSDSLYVFDVGVAYNQDANTPEPKKLIGNYYNKAPNENYKVMQYLYYGRSFSGGKFSVLGINRGDEAVLDSLGNGKETKFAQLFGGTGSYKFGAVKLAGEAYYQMGKTIGDADISAFMFDVNVSVKAGSIPLTLGYQYLSGDDDPDKVTAFNPWFGTNHKFNGFMDYFYVGNPHGDVGLQDIYLQTSLKTGSKTALIAHLHHFLSAVDVKDDTDKSYSSTLGTEIDLVFNVNLSPDANLKFGYSHMFSTESMDVLKSTPEGKDQINNWGWVMLTIKPTLLKL